jgi:predicted transcriptional regulator
LLWKNCRYVAFLLIETQIIKFQKKIGLDARRDWGYTKGMKTAISLPKDVFEKAERIAIRARKSRSQLYCEALREYVARHSPDEVTEALDRAIEENGQPEERFVTLTSAQTLAKVEW